MVKDQEIEFLFLKMVEKLLESGKMSYQMDLVLQLIIMVRAMKGSGKMEKNQETERTIGQMEKNMLENGKITYEMD